MSGWQNRIKTIDFKQAWYDWECNRARKKSFRTFRKWRKSGIRTHGTEYNTANKYYQALCKEKKRKYYEGIVSRLKKVRDRKDWWQLVSEFKERKFVGSAVEIEELELYFSEMIGPVSECVRFVYASPFLEDQLLDSDIELNELLDVVLKLKDNKAPGNDRVPAEYFKYGPIELLEFVRELFASIMNGGELDECFNKSLIFPIFKKGNVDDVSNYRGISFGNTIGKILASVLNERLCKWVNEHQVLSEYPGWV